MVCQLYRQHEITELSDLSPFNVSEKLDIELHLYDEKSEALLYEGKKYIFLNENLDGKEMWRQYCHELGHLMLHRGNQMTFSTCVLNSFISFQEVKADNFALYACAPTHILDKHEVYKMDLYSACRFLECECKLENHYAKRRLYDYERLCKTREWNVNVMKEKGEVYHGFVSKAQ